MWKTNTHQKKKKTGKKFPRGKMGKRVRQWLRMLLTAPFLTLPPGHLTQMGSSAIKGLESIPEAMFGTIFLACHSFQLNEMLEIDYDSVSLSINRINAPKMDQI